MNKKKTRRSKNVLPLKVRMAVIHDYKTITTNARVLSERYGCGRTQIQNIIKARKELEALYNASRRNASHNSRNINIKEEKSVSENISDSLAIVLYEWCQRSQIHGLQIDEQLLESAADNIAPLLGVENQQPKEGWVKSILSRYDFSFNNGQEKVPEQSFKSLKYTDIMDELGIKYNIPIGMEHYTYSTTAATIPGPKNSRKCWEKISSQQKVKPAHVLQNYEKQITNADNSIQNTAPPTKDVSSYREALNVLGPLERFVLLKGNIRAVGLINQLENVFRHELEKILQAGGVD